MVDMELAIRDAYSQVANLGYLVYYLLLGCDAEQIKEKIVICPGVPIAPMLAKPTKGNASASSHPTIGNESIVERHLRLTHESMRFRCASLHAGLSDVLEAMSGCAFRAEYKYDGERIQIHKLASGEVQ